MINEMERSMADQLQVLYKLMTLYTLSRVDFAMTNKQIAGIFTDLGYTNYFNAQYTISDLVDAGLIHEEACPDCFYYSLTDAGRASLDALKNDLGPDIRSDIDAYLKKNRLSFREAVSTRAQYYRTTSGDYAAACAVLEHSEPLMELTLTVPTEQQAKMITKQWKEKSPEIYSYLFRTLSDFTDEDS
jgi:DNA-binding MarR family transcriptional regulator